METWFGIRNLLVPVVAITIFSIDLTVIFFFFFFRPHFIEPPSSSSPLSEK